MPNTINTLKKNTADTTQSLGQTYNTLQGTVVKWDVQWLQQAVNESSGAGAVVLISGIFLFVIVSSIIETGTFFGILLPSDLILSASVITFVGMKRRWLVLVVTVLSIGFTVVGDLLGYATGRKLWAWLYDKEDTRYFKKKYFLEAQSALTKNGEKMLYIWRYLSIGGFLPTIYGVMNWDKKQFFRVSVLSAAMRKLSLVIPIVILMLLFPALQYRVGILLILCFTLPEIIGWIMLFRPQAKEYMQRLIDAKEQISMIRQDISLITDHVEELWDKVKTTQVEESVPTVTSPTITTNPSNPNNPTPSTPSTSL